MVKKRRQRSSKTKSKKKQEFYHQPRKMPGTIIIDENAESSSMYLIEYNLTEVIYQPIKTPEECSNFLDKTSISWIDVRGLGTEDILQKMGVVFDLHPLVLEDVINVVERPKIEEHEGQLVIIVRMVIPKKNDGFHSEQVSMILGENYLLTLQEEPEHDCFSPVRLRIRYNKGIIRKRGVDYLVYALLDAIIDGFFPVLEMYGERIEDLESEAIFNPSRETLQKIYRIRRELLQLRRSIWPQRNVINSLIRDSNELISDEVRIYLRDCYDHTVQVMDMVETYRELSSSLMDVYLSAVGNKMNEIMKVLTVVSSIFIPLTFIAGIYGMNFNTQKSPYNMPELNWYWGYPLCLTLMVIIAISLLVFFWKRGWLENSSTIKHD